MRILNPMTKRRSASLYGTDKFICVHALYGYRRALLADDGFRAYIAADASDESLGSSVLRALNESHAMDPVKDRDFFDGRRHYETYKGWLNEAMAKYNMRSKSQMFKHLAYCSIHREKGKISIEPHAHRGSDRIDVLGDDQIVEIPASTNAIAVGAAVRLAMSRCA